MYIYYVCGRIDGHDDGESGSIVLQGLSGSMAYVYDMDGIDGHDDGGVGGRWRVKKQRKLKTQITIQSIHGISTQK
jgi:hypothetical protein